MGSIVSSVTRDQVIDEMIPRRSREKALEKISEFNSVDKRTKVVWSKNFGFKKQIGMYVNPELSDDEIMQKLARRL